MFDELSVAQRSPVSQLVFVAKENTQTAACLICFLFAKGLLQTFLTLFLCLFSHTHTTHTRTHSHRIGRVCFPCFSIGKKLFSLFDQRIHSLSRSQYTHTHHCVVFTFSCFFGKNFLFFSVFPTGLH